MATISILSLTRHRTMDPHLPRYNTGNMAAAAAYIDRLSANLGGTELVAPLTHVLGKPAIAGYARQVLVLTDGQVSDTQVRNEGQKENEPNRSTSTCLSRLFPRLILSLFLPLSLALPSFIFFAFLDMSNRTRCVHRNRSR